MPTPIVECPEEDVITAQGILTYEGIKNCRVSSATHVDLAASAVQQMPRQPEWSLIDAVVYCTDTATQASAREDMWRFLQQIDAASVPGVVVSGHGCGNIGPGLETAMALAGRGEHGTVLLVTVDRASSGSRFLPSGLTVLSDGAAACLVGRDVVEASFRLMSSCLTADAGLDTQASRMRVARIVHRYIARAVTTVASPAGLDRSAFRHLVVANHGTSARNFQATLSVKLRWDTGRDNLLTCDYRVGRDGTIDGHDHERS